jgi:hypothetical protein
MNTRHFGSRKGRAEVCLAPAHDQFLNGLVRAFAHCALAAVFCLSPLATGSSARAQTAAPENDEDQIEREARKKLLDELSRGQSAKDARQSCIVIVANPGSLAANPEASELASVGWGGRSASAEVIVTNGSYDLTVDAPLGFSSAPAGGNDATVFRAAFSGNGATNFSETPGTSRIRLKKGSTLVTANLWATKTTGAFVAGQYRANITIRCE